MIDPTEQQLRQGMRTIAAANPPADDFADRLIVNAEAGRPAVTPLRSRSTSRRWTIPLLAAACVVAVAAVVVTTKLNADDQRNLPPAVPVAPSSSTAPSAVTSSVAQQPGIKNPVLLRQVPAATGVPGGFRAESLSFSDANNGWVIGQAPCEADATKVCPMLLSTTDQGASFSTVPLPKEFGPGRDFVTSGTLAASYGGGGRGYVRAGDSQPIWGTQNAGATWTPTREPASAAVSLIPTAGGTTYRFQVSQDRATPGLSTLSYAATGSTDFSAVTLQPALGPNETMGGIIQVGRGVDAVTYPAAGRVNLFALSSGRSTTREALDETVCPSGQRPAAGVAILSVAIGGPDGTLALACSGEPDDKGLAVSSVRIRPPGGEFGTARRLPVPPLDPRTGMYLANGALVITSAEQIGMMQPVAGAATTCAWIRSEDGGATWSPPRQFPDAFCASAPDSGADRAFSNVPGLFVGLTQSGPRGKISAAPAQLRWTTDNGATWFQRSLGPA